MPRLYPPSILLRTILPAAFIVASGIGLRSHQAAASLQHARLAALAGDHSSAAIHFVSAAERLPYRPDLWQSAGDQAMLAHDHAAAIHFYQQALDRNKLTSQGYLTLGRALAAAGDQDGAVHIWQAYLSRFEPSAEVYSLLADAALHNQDFARAAEYFQDYIQLEPGDPNAYYHLGLILAATQPRLASAPLTTARELDPSLDANVNILLQGLRAAQFENPPAYIFTLSGQALGAVGEWSLAHHALQTAADLDPSYSEAWAYLGEAKQQLGESGQVELEVAWGLNPDSLAANTLLAIHWQRRNDYEQALFFMLRAAGIDPHNPSIQADLGALYLGSGDLEAALQHYRKAVDLAPGQTDYWYLLASFCVEHEIYLLEDGLPAAERLVALDPRSPANYVLLGRAYFLLLDNENAAQAYQLALQLNPDFAPTHLHLALLYMRLEDMQAAHRHLELARDLDPGGEIGLNALQLLAQYFP